MKIVNAGDRIMNTYIYPTDGGYVMIDTGYEHSYKSVLRKMKKHGLEPSQIKYVFLTHAHDDHAGFLNVLLTDYPNIKVIADEKSLPVLRNGQNSFEGGCSGFMAFAFCKLMGLLGKGEHQFPPIEEKYLERFIFLSKDGAPENRIAQMEKELGGKILFTPGHTCDSISLKVGNLLFCGDAAMNGFPSSNRITIWVNDKEDFERSWDVLLSQNAKKIVPAHGKPFSPEDLEKNRHWIRRKKLYALK